MIFPGIQKKNNTCIYKLLGKVKRDDRHTVLQNYLQKNNKKKDQDLL